MLIKAVHCRACLLLAALLILLLPVPASLAAGEDWHEPAVLELDELLRARPDLGQAVDAAIGEAALAGIGDREQFYSYLDTLLNWIPTERRISWRY